MQIAAIAGAYVGWIGRNNNDFEIPSLLKVSGMKEELSGLIGELKNDVDDKGAKIEEDRKARFYSFSNFS